MPETTEPNMEEYAREELRKIGNVVANLRRRLRELQAHFPETDEDHPMTPNTVWAVCEEVGEGYLDFAESRLRTMSNLTPLGLRNRRETYRIAISTLMAAASRLPEEYVAVAVRNLMRVSPEEFLEALAYLRREPEELWVAEMIRERTERTKEE